MSRGGCTDPCPLRKCILGWTVIAFAAMPLFSIAQGGDKLLRGKADALFADGSYAEALPMYSQLVSLAPDDHDLSYRLGACTLYGSDDKEKAIGFLKFAVQGPATDNLAWYFLGRAYHLDYRFDEAITAYEHYRGTADRKLLAKFPVDALEQQCRNGKNLLSNIKDIHVFNKVEVDASDFFRFYDLSDIGGKIVVTPDELMTSLDRKSKERSLVYLPTGGGPIYFSSYGKDGKTGRDIYRTTLLPTGGFSTPEKLAGYVNTDQDEDFAVMAPDGKSFYFCSKGHNSMGGYDVFKSTYDKASDVFGAPENMDFAVNTPADEALYVVGPDGEQACFASTRDSKQGMESVYRVSTVQAPINIIVLKGTYASAFDVTDRKAHITVEDALTREQVADVRTDINGQYVLALPRSGQYSFLVEGGPSGKTHLGNVVIPPNDQAVAYRQEIKLVEQGGEKLLITNYFDQPLDGDVMALALDEIKRRARLDVTETKPRTDASTAWDPMTTAGFAGNMSEADALELAKKDAADLAEKASMQDKQGSAAFALAEDNVKAAEMESKKAVDLVDKAIASADETVRMPLMTQAAQARQRSNEANARARAAFLTGSDLDSLRRKTREQATRSRTLAATLSKAIEAQDTAAITASLKQLKAGLDERAGPDAIDEVERLRRAATDAEKEAARKLREANAQRQEETALTERIDRMKGDLDAAKGHKKDDLSHAVTELQGQLSALHDETEHGFANARAAEDDAVLARGESALMDHLAANPDVLAEGPPREQIARLEPRIDHVNSGNKALVIDERYDTGARESAAVRERRMFDWGLGSHAVAETGVPLEAPSTPVGTGEDAKAANSPTIAAKASNNADGSLAAALPKNGTTQRSSASPQKQQAPTDTMEGQMPDMGTASPAEADTTADTGTAVDEDEQLFFEANKLAELKQLRQGAKGRTERDSLDAAIAVQQARMETLAGTKEEKGGSIGHTYTLLDFDPATLDEELVEEISPGFALRRKQIEEGAENPHDQAMAQHALEMELVDSIDAQIARQSSQLRQHPEQASAIQARLDRLRTLKVAHLGMADKALVLADRLDDTGNATAAEDTGRSDVFVEPEEALAPIPVGNGAATSVQAKDGYVTIAPDPAHIYQSAVAFRSPKVEEAVAMNKDDEKVAEGLQAEIDSLNAVLRRTPEGVRHDELQERIDRETDDLLIQTTQIGQRNAFIMKEEYSTALDSSARLERALQGKEVSPDGPISRMARDLQDTAKAGFGRAVDVRKQADRTRDILKRDSLYREAYGTELLALREANRSNTVRNYLLREDVDPMEAISYAEVERRMAQGQQPLASNADQGKPLPPVSDRKPNENPISASTAVAEDRSAQTPTSDGSNGQVTAPQVRTVPEATSTADPEQTLATPIDQEDEPRVQKVDLERPSRQDSMRMAMADTEGTAAADVVTHPVDEVAPAMGPAAKPKSSAAAEDSISLQEYLDRFYPSGLGAGDPVFMDPDMSRYFLLKGRSLAWHAEADSALAKAGANMDAAWDLRNRASALRGLMDGGAGDAERAARVEQMESHAVILRSQADSLQLVARQTADRAKVSDGQAATFLQTLPPERASAIEQMEQERRKARPVLANDRPVAPPPTTMESAARSGTASDLSSTVPTPTVPSTAVEHEDVVEERPAETNDRLPARRPEVASPASVPSRMLTKEVFVLGTDASDRTAPIPLDVAMPQGVVYKVQVGAFRNALPAGAFGDMDPVTGETVGNGLVRYTAGLFTDAASASKAKQQIRARGYADAFVVAYINGRRVPLRKAAQAEQQGVPASSVVAETTTATRAPASVEPSAPVSTPDASVLAKYPTSAAEVLNSFDPAPNAASYYNDPSAAPAKPVESIKGLFFTVQVGVYSKPTALDRLFNITPLNSELTANGKIRYTTGIYRDIGNAAARKNGTVQLGVTDAFVTAYLNGKRIPVGDAKALLAKFGSSVLVDPSLGTP